MCIWNTHYDETHTRRQPYRYNVIGVKRKFQTVSHCASNPIHLSLLFLHHPYMLLFGITVIEALFLAN